MDYRDMRTIGIETLRAEVARLRDLGISPHALAAVEHADGLEADRQECCAQLEEQEPGNHAALGHACAWTEVTELEAQRDAELTDSDEFVLAYFEDVAMALNLIQEAR
jgi:hypothetical protein